MNPEDRVLVGVINRKRDFLHTQNDHWYRIPQRKMPNGIHAEYVAFFLSGRVFGANSGSIRDYARYKGVELVYRRDLLPNELDHPRADDTYFRIALDDLRQKDPPILNPNRRPISFIYTTWDRFIHATEIKHLYSESDYYVDRIYHALRNRGIHSDRTWEAEQYVIPSAPSLRVASATGILEFSTRKSGGTTYLDMNEPEDKILKRIREELAKRGGLIPVNTSFEDR